MSTVATMLNELQATEAEARLRAAADYFDILGRNEAPKRGDKEQLRECMTTLGRTTHDVQGDLELVQQLVRCRPLAESLAALRGEAQRLHCEHAEAEKQAAREREEFEAAIRERLAPLEAAKARNQNEIAAADEARRSLSRHEIRWLAIAEGISFDEAERRYMERVARERWEADGRPVLAHGRRLVPEQRIERLRSEYGFSVSGGRTA